MLSASQAGTVQQHIIRNAPFCDIVQNAARARTGKYAVGTGTGPGNRNRKSGDAMAVGFGFPVRQVQRAAQSFRCSS